MCHTRAARLQEAGSSDADSVNHRFISTALPHLVPLLLEQLTKQEEGQETDDGVWNVSMAAGRHRPAGHAVCNRQHPGQHGSQRSLPARLWLVA